MNYKYSIIIPAKDEEESLNELVEQIKSTMSSLSQTEPYEVILIDDGSEDRSWELIQELSSKHNEVKGIKLRRNFGKAAALSAGFRDCAGEFIITIDADLQDRPAEIPRLVEKINEGFDLVSGWKQKRYDPVSKTLPSKFFNYVTSRVSGLELHDFNCGFKIYRREVLESINLYGELHRFIPVLAHWRGFRVSEIAVEHRERQFGVSKYGISRLFKGFFDLLTVVLTNKYFFRPMHFFGYGGILVVLLGGAILFYLFIIWLFGLGPIGTRPLLTFGMLLTIVGCQSFLFGLLGELMIKTNNTGLLEYDVAQKTSEQ